MSDDTQSQAGWQGELPPWEHCVFCFTRTWLYVPVADGSQRVTCTGCGRLLGYEVARLQASGISHQASGA